MQESTLTPCQSRLYTLYFISQGLRIWPLVFYDGGYALDSKEVKILIYIFMIKDPIQRQRFFSFYTCLFVTSFEEFILSFLEFALYLRKMSGVHNLHKQSCTLYVYIRLK
jgi:hypothetical protein